MSEKNRWFTLKKLLDTIREKPITVNELQGLTGVMNGKPVKYFPQSRATLYNWLHDLETLGLIYNENGSWCPIESKKPQFSTKTYNLAVDHANRLLYGKEGISIGVATHPMNFLMQLIVEENEEVKEFLNHLKTGAFYQQTYKKIKAYQLAMTKRGELLKKISGGNIEIDQVESDTINFDYIKQNFTMPSDILLLDTVKKKGQLLKSNNLFQKIDVECDTLIQEIAGELVGFFNQVAKGPNPLDGYCDSCSHLRVTIRE